MDQVIPLVGLIIGAYGYYWARRGGRGPWRWFAVFVVVSISVLYVLLGALRGLFPELGLPR